MSSSRAWVSTMMVTSSGIRFCSMRSRAVRKSVSDADGKPISISLRPTEHSVLNRRFLVSRLMGSNRAWLPSRRSVLHHTGTLFSVREGHCRFGRSMVGKGRYLLDGSCNIAASLCGSGARLPHISRSRLGFQSCQRRLVARVWLRLGRKKQEAERQQVVQSNLGRNRISLGERHAQNLPQSRAIDNEFEGDDRDAGDGGHQAPPIRSVAELPVRTAAAPCKRWAWATFCSCSGGNAIFLAGGSDRIKSPQKSGRKVLNRALS